MFGYVTPGKQRNVFPMLCLSDRTNIVMSSDIDEHDQLASSQSTT